MKSFPDFIFVSREPFQISLVSVFANQRAEQSIIYLQVHGNINFPFHCNAGNDSRILLFPDTIISHVPLYSLTHLLAHSIFHFFSSPPVLRCSLTTAALTQSRPQPFFFQPSPREVTSGRNCFKDYEEKHLVRSPAFLLGFWQLWKLILPKMIC